MIGHQSDRDFESMASHNMIQNCPITFSNITNSHTMFGPKIAGIRGRIVQHNSYRVVMDYVDVPRGFLNDTCL